MAEEKRVAIVTGAARGIGASCARLLAAKGRRVVLTDIDIEPTQAVADEINAQGGEGIVIGCDVSIPAEVERLVADTAGHFGRVDILINNAGICPRIPLDDMTEAWFDRIVNVNMKSIFFLTRAAANAMKSQRWGRVVNVSSTGGRIGGLHNSTVYSATKGAVLSMTKTMAREYADYNILINAVAPGAVDTRMFDIDPATREAYRQTIPLKRYADPVEVAHAIVGLTTEDMTWVTGATLDVNGGVVMV